MMTYKISVFPGIFLVLASLFSVKCTQAEDGDTNKKPVREGEYVIAPDQHSSSVVSDKLMGFNLVYPHEKNSIWQDGKIAGYLKDVNVGFLRYPGGTVCSYYHWNALTGEGWKDSWDKENPVMPKQPSEFMDMDEYMALVKATGATPLVGINMSSGRRWNKNEDGLLEAIALMQYCRDKNFKVEYWYLDNEPYQHDSNGGAKTPEEYAQLINVYAEAMKSFDPDIKLVANWNAGFKNKRADYERLIRLAGANIDVIDVHWYWNWSDPSWEKWLEKTPMEQWTGESYAEDIAYFRQMVTGMGYPHMELASFEWNSGPLKPGSFTASRSALTQAEMMMQFIAGGLDYAVFWPVHWPNESTLVRSFVNPVTRDANPNYHLFQFLGKMQGGELLPVQIIKPGQNMVTIAVRDAGQKILRIAVLNKAGKDVVTDIQMNLFPGMKLKEGREYTVVVDGTDYAMREAEILDPDLSGATRFLSHRISITMLTFGE